MAARGAAVGGAKPKVDFSPRPSPRGSFRLASLTQTSLSLFLLLSFGPYLPLPHSLIFTMSPTLSQRFLSTRGGSYGVSDIFRLDHFSSPINPLLPAESIANWLSPTIAFLRGGRPEGSRLRWWSLHPRRDPYPPRRLGVGMARSQLRGIGLPYHVPLHLRVRDPQ